MPATPSRPPACPHFRHLVDNAMRASRLSVRKLEEHAGLPEKRIGQYYGRRTQLNEPPPLRVCKSIATALAFWIDCEPNDVWLALSKDAGLLPPQHDLTPEQVARERAIDEAGNGYGEAIDRMLDPWLRPGAVDTPEHAEV